MSEFTSTDEDWLRGHNFQQGDGNGWLFQQGDVEIRVTRETAKYCKCRIRLHVGWDDLVFTRLGGSIEQAIARAGRYLQQKTDKVVRANRTIQGLFTDRSRDTGVSGLVEGLIENDDRPLGGMFLT